MRRRVRKNNRGQSTVSASIGSDSVWTPIAFRAVTHGVDYILSATACREDSGGYAQIVQSPIGIK